MKEEKRVFKSVHMQIDKNVLRWDSVVVQLSSISTSEVSPMPKENYSPFLFLGMCLGSAGILSKTSPFVSIGFALIIVCLFVGYFKYRLNSELGDYLVLELNSGTKMVFSCYDKGFLYRAQEVLVDCFNGSSDHMVINFDSCKIGGYDMQNNISGSNNTIGDIVGKNKQEVNDGGLVIGGDVNRSIIGSSDSTINNNLAEDWLKAEEYFQEAIHKFVLDSQEYDCCARAADYCSKKDKKGLTAYIERYMEVFKAIFASVASESIKVIIKKLIGLDF